MEHLDFTKILTAEEVAQVLADLRCRAKRSVNAFQNLIIFRLACCCGLRRKEISGLNLGDIALSGPRPFIRVRKETTKGEDGKRRTRKVPLWWDAMTRADIQAWVEFRLSMPSAGLDAPMICSFNYRLQRLNPARISEHWLTAIKVLGPERVKQVSIHGGRHSFCSHALRAGRTLTEVRDAAGHTSIGTTNIYLHSLDEDVPDLFPMPKEKR